MEIRPDGEISIVIENMLRDKLKQVTREEKEALEKILIYTRASRRPRSIRGGFRARQTG